MQDSPPIHREDPKQRALNEINALYTRFVKAARQGDTADSETLRIRINTLMQEARETFHVHITPANLNMGSGYFAFRDLR